MGTSTTYTGKKIHILFVHAVCQYINNAVINIYGRGFLRWYSEGLYGLIQYFTLLINPFKYFYIYKGEKIKMYELFEKYVLL